MGSTGSNFGEAWRYDKGAFKTWATKASTEDGVEKKQLYAHLALSFGDVDNDKDGWINPEEFDLLLEKVAALPRRFGLAPSWQVEYGGDAARRTAARKAMFDAIDGADGFKPRGKIAMGQFIKWSMQHVGGKSQTIAKLENDVALSNPEKHTVEEYLAFLDKAVNDKKSGASASFYNHLLKVFVEADGGCKGKINFEEYNKLIDLAAATPRFFKLAPDTMDTAARKAMFESMDSTKSGFVTFRKFLRYTREHMRGKVAAHK